jgi:NADH dehydrogenase FAD-containing subunit
VARLQGVTSVDFKLNTVKLNDGSSLSYDYIIMSTGGIPRVGETPAFSARPWSC